MSMKQPVSITDILVRRGKVTEETVAQIREGLDPEMGLSTEKALVQKKFISEADATLAIAEYLDMRPIGLANFMPEEALLKMLPRGLLQKYRVVPLAQTARTLTVAMSDPFNLQAIEELHVASALHISPLVAGEHEVNAAMRRAFPDEERQMALEDVMHDQMTEMEFESVDDSDQQSLEEMMEGAEDQPIIRMVNSILIEAVRLRANDIHIEAQEDHVRLRYRVDGVLVEQPKLPKNLQGAILSRIKILSDMDIGEQRVPQDGRFRINTLNRVIDVRVSVLPTIHGGRAVMRLLDKNALFPSLSSLNLDDKSFHTFSYAIAQPHGIILVTGPTGSGKTTTLYSCLQELNQPDVNIVTCEDPVEYQIPGIVQTRIMPSIGCTFAAALRAILRQDPDIVLIGEIRDDETAEIAIKAALTGHLVLSTLHANDSPGTVTRLLDMGIEPFLLSSSLILAQAQRLYRKLCTACRTLGPVDPAMLDFHKIDPAEFEGISVYHAGGCPQCRKTGYKGRGVVMEVLPVDDDIRMSIMKRDNSDVFRSKAEENGMIPLAKAILQKVKDGTTSLDDAARIISTR